MKAKTTEALQWIVTVLRQKNIPFQITGGLAAHIYGASRPINDIDIDILEKDLARVTDAVHEYIIYGPARYRDKKWDVQLLTLKYHDQEIDLGGALETKIYDEATGAWTPCVATLDTAQEHTIEGIELPVVEPQSLIAYKTLLTGAHQTTDIKAVRKYLQQTGHENQ
ncbi:MAG: nucleotidyltransferase [Candidatus Doudnabacteria bacterium]|nr:nucleotidyltransferase [Candidatus Doudnabacteria bacterium]